MKKSLLLIIAALALSTSLIMSGCGESETSSAEETTSAAASAVTSAADTTAEASALESTSATTTAPASTAATKATQATKPTQATQPTTQPATKSQQSSSGNSSGNSSGKQQSSKQQSSKQQSQQPAKKEGSFSASDTVFVTQGKSVALGSDMSGVLSSLGNANSVESQLSCHGVGEDKTYNYNGFVINTYPLNNKDYVMEVVVNSSNISTPKGIHIGSSEADVIAAYGSGYNTVGCYYSYETGDGKSIQFFIDNGTVSEIDYYYNV